MAADKTGTGKRFTYIDKQARAANTDIFLVWTGTFDRFIGNNCQVILLKKEQKGGCFRLWKTGCCVVLQESPAPKRFGWEGWVAKIKTKKKKRLSSSLEHFVSASAADKYWLELHPVPRVSGSGAADKTTNCFLLIWSNARGRRPPKSSTWWEEVESLADADISRQSTTGVLFQNWFSLDITSKLINFDCNNFFKKLKSFDTLMATFKYFCYIGVLLRCLVRVVCFKCDAISLLIICDNQRVNGGSSESGAIPWPSKVAPGHRLSNILAPRTFNLSTDNSIRPQSISLTRSKTVRPLLLFCDWNSPFYGSKRI